jgi:predicted DNA-binding transcriptional regulator AlpA
LNAHANTTIDQSRNHHERRAFSHTAPLEKTMFRVDEVLQRYGLSKSTLYWMMGRGLFPRPCKISLRVVAFRLQDLLAWEAAQRPAELAAT